MRKRIVLLTLLFLVTLALIWAWKTTQDYLAYKEVATSDNVEVLQSYLRNSPRASYRADILSQLEELRWENTNASGTLEAYQNFLKDYADSSHAQEASRRLEEKTWEKVVLASDKESFKAFAAKFPKSPRAEEARQRSQDFIVTVSEFGPAELADDSMPLLGVVAKIKPQWGAMTVDTSQESAVAIFRDGTEMKLFAIGWLGWKGLSTDTVGPVSAMSGAVLKVNDKWQKEYYVTVPSNTGWQKLKFDKSGHADLVLVFKGEARDLASLRVFNSLVSVPGAREAKAHNPAATADLKAPLSGR